MPELELMIGDRKFAVSCQPGEEPHLNAAAALLDAEAKVVSESVGRVPESRMLLMAGLMLADKMSAKTEQESYAEERVQTLEGKLREAEMANAKLTAELNLQSQAAQAPAPEAAFDEERLTRLAESLEQLAGELEDAVNA